MGVRIQQEAFDAGAEIDALRRGADAGAVGAVAAFVGVARDRNDGAAVATLSLEHYPGMTERSIEAIIERARTRWQLLGVTVIHRVGVLQPADPIVFVAVSSAHRGEAFAACEYIMDYLKTEAPFWKKELTPAGERWVEARESDEQARDRWDSSPG